MQIVALIVFVVLQILFLPVALVGILMVTYRQIMVSKRLGISQTAIEVINGRWTMHVFGLREDLPTMQLMSVLPNTSPLGLWLTLFPLWITQKLTGTRFLYPREPAEGEEGLRDFVMSRTVYIDQLLDAAAEDATQFVVMGAGYDTRCYGTMKRTEIRCFEVDQTAVQRHKVATVEAAGLDASHVTYVEVDFAHEDAFDKLQQAGYDLSQKTLFLWEGVTLYLSEEAVRRALCGMREHAAAGSTVVADFYSSRFLAMAGGKAASKTLDYTGEGLRFSLPLETGYEETLRQFLESEGWRPERTFFMGRNRAKGPFMAVVSARI